MKDFNAKLAVVTGGGHGMGQELVRQLAAEGCHVALCDIFEEPMLETKALAEKGARGGTRVSTFVADVSDEEQVLAFRDAVAADHDTDQINLLFNNAGIGAGGSFVTDDREMWDKTFGVCWGGVYHCTRAFLPMLLACTEGHVVNTSSVNGFWATLGAGMPHTAYSAAKFAVKGFSEALILDFRANAPHIGVSVVMPGHIGTSIVLNSLRAVGRDPKEMTTEHLAEIREMLGKRGIDMSGASDEDLRQGIQMQGEMFRDMAPMTAAEAATVILRGVREGRWRILVGADAEVVDQMVRKTPEDAYEDSFWQAIRAQGVFGFAGP